MAHVTLSIGDVDAELDILDEEKVNDIIGEYDFRDIIRNVLTDLPDNQIVDVEEIQEAAAKSAMANLDTATTAHDVAEYIVRDVALMRKFAEAVAKQLTVTLSVEEE
jgi:hypothetical protein